MRATLLADVPESSDIARHETFGPVAALEVVADEDAGVARANATSYGLSAGIITTNTDKGLALADRIEAGIVHINEQTIGDEPQMPFGGVKDSGWGRFGGAAALDEFSELKWVTVQSGSHPTRSDAGTFLVVLGRVGDDLDRAQCSTILPTSPKRKMSIPGGPARSSRRRLGPGHSAWRTGAMRARAARWAGSHAPSAPIPRPRRPRPTSTTSGNTSYTCDGIRVFAATSPM